MTKTIVITGPTASGKTRRAVDVARKLGGEIVSADSRQVYRGMDIGTGKDMEEYGEIPVHMVDVVDAGYRYNLYEYLRDANRILDRLKEADIPAVICGGTGLYVESLVKGIRLPEVPADYELRQRLETKSLAELTAMLADMKQLHNITDVDTVKRAVRAIEIELYYKNHPDAALLTKGDDREGDRMVLVGMDIDRDIRRHRITQRLYQRLQDGMIDEVKVLLDNGVDSETLLYYGLEYKYITNYLLGNMDYETMVRDLEIAIHQFAKRQMTWFRGMERRGLHIHWLPYDLEAGDFTEQVLKLM